MFVPVEYQKRELWRSKYPAVVGALLSVFQLILTLVIVGCEVGGAFVHFSQMNIFVGYWTFPNFMCAWISLAGASCCCRIRCCGITTLVFQCLAIPMALCVIGFDGYFLNNPTLCFFSSCSSYYSSGYYSYSDYSNNSTLYGIKVPLVRGQLAAGVLMLVSCLVYIIIFGIACYQVQSATVLSNGPPMPLSVIHPPTQSQNIPSYVNPPYAGPVPQNPGISVAPPAYVPPVQPPTITVVPKVQLICPNCRSRFHVSATSQS